MVTCGLTVCTPGSAPGPTLGVEYGKPLPFLPFSARTGHQVVYLPLNSWQYHILYWLYQTQLNSTGNYGRRCLTTHHNDLTIINEHYHFMTSSDPFPVPVRSAVRSNLTAWCCQNLPNCTLSCTVQIDSDSNIQIIMFTQQAMSPDGCETVCLHGWQLRSFPVVGRYLHK